MTEPFPKVFSDNYESVYRLALGRSHADAEDIAQEVFVAVMRALPHFRREARLSTWIYRIAIRIGARWKMKRGLVVTDLHESQVVDQSIPIDLINGISRLPMDARTIVLLVCIEGLSHDEASEVLGISAGTVASRLHYAKKRLLELI